MVVATGAALLVSAEINGSDPTGNGPEEKSSNLWALPYILASSLLMAIAVRLVVSRDEYLAGGAAVLLAVLISLAAIRRERRLPETRRQATDRRTTDSRQRHV